MHYFDTSYLVPLLVPEATSERVADFLRGLPPGDLAISHWTRLEFSSLLGREVRMGHLAAKTAALIDAQFQDLVERSFVVLLPTAEDFTLARNYLGHHRTGLRAGDALHLAIAHNHRAAAIYSFDKTLLKAGRRLGVSVSTGFRLVGY